MKYESSVGNPTDPEAIDDGTLIAIAKRQRTLLEDIAAGGGGGGNPNGQALMADSAPVVIASDQSPVPVVIDDWLGSAAPTVGQKTMAASLPVTIASDQGALPVAPHAVTQSGGPWTVREINAAYTWVSVRSAAPGIAAVQADTGPLAAGTYDFVISLMISDTVAVNKGLIVEHRNAANGATLFNLGGASPNGGAIVFELRAYTLALNERIRVIAGGVAGAAGSIYVSAIGRRVSP